MLLGLKSHAQQDSTSIDSVKFYQVQGWQIRNSFEKMMRGHQLKIELNSCTSMTLSLLDRVKYSDSLLNVRDGRILTLTELNNNYIEEIDLDKNILEKEKKENKKKRIRQGIVVAAAAFVLGLLTSILI